MGPFRSEREVRVHIAFPPTYPSNRIQDLYHSPSAFLTLLQRISTASQSSQPPFLQGSASGMLGLGFPALMASDGVVPWWIRLIRDGQLGQSETLFAIWLARFVVDITP